jgi:small subunit ribosomal protein S6
MFLFPQTALSDLKAAVSHVTEILERHNAEIVSLKKWDERRLAYDIRGNKRGVYLLVYFQAPANEMQKIERDFNLSERLLRSLIIRADHVSQDTMIAADGRVQLEDEIKLRASGVEPAPRDDQVESRHAMEEPALAIDDE